MLYRVLQNHQNHSESSAVQPGDVIRFNYVNEVLLHFSLCSSKEKHICILKSDSENCHTHFKFKRILTVVHSQVNCENMLYYYFLSLLFTSALLKLNKFQYFNFSIFVPSILRTVETII